MVKIAVAVPEVIEGAVDKNFQTSIKHIDRAGAEGVDILLFPETALSGLAVTNIYENDCKNAISLDSVHVSEICKGAAKAGVWVGIGFLEQFEEKLYDSAILIDNVGNVKLHYRRMSEGWTWPNAPAAYGYGLEYPVADTPWGKAGFLICGDIFNASEHAAKAGLDLLLCPVACSFDFDLKNPQKDWEENFWPDYAAQFNKIGAYAVMSNYVEKQTDCHFHGGAHITNRHGVLLFSRPLYKPGLLIEEVEINVQT